MPGRPVLAAVFSCRSLTRECSSPFVFDFQACGPSSIITRMPRTAQRWLSRPARISASIGPSSRPAGVEEIISHAMEALLKRCPGSKLTSERASGLASGSQASGPAQQFPNPTSGGTRDRLRERPLSNTTSRPSRGQLQSSNAPHRLYAIEHRAETEQRAHSDEDCLRAN